MIRIVYGVLLSVFLVVALVILLFTLRQNGLLGKSDFYRSLDVNSDQELSYVEWMRYYASHGHPLERCSRSDFYQADCDGNDSLTWTEYHDFRFKRRHCMTYSSLSELLTSLDAREKQLMARYGFDSVEP